MAEGKLIDICPNQHGRWDQFFLLSFNVFSINTPVFPGMSKQRHLEQTNGCPNQDKEPVTAKYQDMSKVALEPIRAPVSPLSSEI